MIWSELKYAVRASINQLSSRGTIKPAAKVADLVMKLKYFVNPLLYELAQTTGKIAATETFVLNPVDNALGSDTSSIKSFTGTDVTYELVGAKAYWFEAVGPATVYIEEYTGGAWVVLSTITILSSVTEFTEYKGLIAPSSATNRVRLRFSGTSPYSYRNYKLYTYTWATEAEIQQHRPDFKFVLPADFLEMNQVYIRKDARQFVPFSTYVWEEPNIIWVNRYYGPAEIRASYWRKPTVLTWTEPSDILDSATIDATEDACNLLPLAMSAAVLRSVKDDASATVFQNLWEIGLSKLTGNKGNYTGSVTNVTGW